ncbi:SAM-dependent methyltransferase [Streptomyces sp. NPDC007083]|uniref:SAM-dependent methyltransferase n=1 Tax=Streptomyces sp. NPDC007083 TaxID=3156913 RepID=UPI0033EDE5CB
MPRNPSTTALDPTKPTVARTYSAMLKQKSNLPSDRSLLGDLMQVIPSFPELAKVNFDYMRRSSQWLARHQGIRRFLDIGSGIIEPPTLHDAVRQVDPGCRVVYVDNDESVLAYREHSTSGVEMLEWDVRDTENLLRSEAVAALLGAGEPVALNLGSVIQWLGDEDEPHRIVRMLVDSLPGGSYLNMTTPTSEFSADVAARVTQVYADHGILLTTRTREEFETFFDGLDEVEITLPYQWRSTRETVQLTPDTSHFLSGIGRVPMRGASEHR